MSHSSERDAYVHQARIYLREARVRARNPLQRGFCFTLIEWAGNCRRKAMWSAWWDNIKPAEVMGQMDLFGDSNG